MAGMVQNAAWSDFHEQNNPLKQEEAKPEIFLRLVM